MKRIFVLLILLFSFGCVSNNFNYKPQTINFSSDIFGDIIEGNGSCVAFKCTKGKRWFFFSEVGLYKANCSFENISSKEYGELISKDKRKYVRMFSIGSGPSFYSFEKTNFYSGGTMKSLVKILRASKLKPYPLPSKSKTKCYLKADVLPIFVLYSNFTNLDVERTGEIAKRLDGLGPVIILTEPNLSSDKAIFYSKIKDQIKIIKQNCPKCLVGLSVKFGDFEVVKAFDDTDYDLVAFGLNNYSSMVLYKLYKFTTNLSLIYKKPSLMYYACFSDNQSYFDLLRNIPYLARRGLISVNFMFNKNPFCNVYSNNSGIYKAIKIYYSAGRLKDTVTQVPLVFPLGPSSCDFGSNLIYISFFKEDSNGISLRDKNLSIQENNQFYSCVSCLHNEPPSNHLTSYSVSDRECSLLASEIGQASEYMDLDEVLLRAIIWEMSDFDNCTIFYSQKGNPLGLEQVHSIHCSSYKDKNVCDDCKPSRYGLTLVPYYPIEIYKEHNLEIPKTVSICSSKFDPFIPSDNLCSFSEDFQTSLDYAEAFINLRSKDLGISKDEEKQFWYKVFFALDRYYYHGSSPVWSDWIKRFKSETNYCERKDFLYFVKHCIKDDDYPPFEIISRYFSLIHSCSNLCVPANSSFIQACNNGWISSQCCAYGSFEEMCKHEECKNYC